MSRKALKRKLGKKVLAGKLTVDEAPGEARPERLIEVCLVDVARAAACLPAAPAGRGLRGGRGPRAHATAGGSGEGFRAGRPVGVELGRRKNAAG